MKEELNLFHDIFIGEEHPTIGTDVLCSYLQYNLTFLGNGTIWSLYSISVDGAVVLKSLHQGRTEVVNGCYLGVRFKPMLIPLEGLSAEKAKELGYKDTKSLRLAIAKGELNYNQFDNLASEHYDLFGLFEDGLAVKK